MLPNYYKILRLRSDCSQNDIKSAFRKLAVKIHPDRNKSKDAHNQFINLYEAYSILKDTYLRSEYDKEYSKYYAVQVTSHRPHASSNTYYDDKTDLNPESANDISSRTYEARKAGEEFSNAPLSKLVRELHLFGNELIFHFVNVVLYLIGYGLILSGIGGLIYGLINRTYLTLIIGLIAGIIGKKILSKSTKRWDMWDFKNN